MTVQQLRTPVMAGKVAAGRRELREVAEVPVGSLRTEELPEVLGELAFLQARVGAPGPPTSPTPPAG